MNIQCSFPLELTGLISLQSKGLSRAFPNTTVHQLFVEGMMLKLKLQYFGHLMCLRPALSLGGQASAWEGSPGRSLCLTKSSACGRLWQFAHPRPLSQVVEMEKILETPLDSKEIKPVNSKGNGH